MGDARLRILPPPTELGGDQNNSSIGVVVERGRFRALLTGDSEQPELSAWLASDSIPAVDVLKAAHHGSRSGVSPGWIARARPKIVVISVGARNPYGYPDRWALRYYEAGGRRVFRTDRDGDIVVTVSSDGSYRVRTGQNAVSQDSEDADPDPSPWVGAGRVTESVRTLIADPTLPGCLRGLACEDTCPM